MINYYELLNVDRKASNEEIKQAYRRMVKKYHPDINKSPEASKMIISLNEAKENLFDEEKRRKYDALLEEREHSKTYTKDNSKSYATKNREYEEVHSKTYVTRWEFFKNYVKFGVDNAFVKILKIMLVGINFVFFHLLKYLCIAIAYIMLVLGNVTSYIAILLVIVGILGFFVLEGRTSPDYVSFMPANVEHCVFYSALGVIVAVINIVIVRGSINMSVVFQSIEDKILVKVLMK